MKNPLHKKRIAKNINTLRFNYKKLKSYLFFREILNYFFIRKSIRKERKSETWLKFKLNADWIGRIYVVLNLRKEDVGEEDLVKRAKIFEMMSPINLYIKKLDLHEIVFPSILKKSEQSYLIIYTPIFNYFSIIRLTKYLIFICALIWMYINTSQIISFITNLL